VAQLVSRQIARATERHQASLTLVGFDASVYAHVKPNSPRVLKPTTTHRADMRHLVRVGAFVERSRAVLNEALSAPGNATGEWTFTGVSHDVSVQGRQRLEQSSTVTTDAWPHSPRPRPSDGRVDQLMPSCPVGLERREIFERLPTHGTMHRPVTTVVLWPWQVTWQLVKTNVLANGTNIAVWIVFWLQTACQLDRVHLIT